ncbi:MAG: MarR family transcriptional regulator [Ferroplasma sp.]|uniref:MarR family winged helix-turn-helix transcriptional regulator n=1 Tax=Ferroplasma sp. TaxID=2591003 RepID=UPI002814CBB2|nr:MarR family transcriptional regulator [Ferroplasma sp.]WMT51480.1 MAG: MarR family transcriptional regulator [Ferroplasma sp.]
MERTITIWSLLDSILTEYGSRIKDKIGEYSLTRTDYKLLYLVSNEPRNMKYLADELSLAKGWVTDITDGLEQMGLVRRIHSNDDRRVINIQITDKGLKVFNEIQCIIKTIINDSVSSLPPEDVEQLCNILEKIDINLKSTNNKK